MNGDLRLTNEETGGLGSYIHGYGEWGEVVGCRC